MSSALQLNQQQIVNFADKLDTLSPLATLKRGFSIATKDHVVLQDTAQLKSGDNIEVQLKKGKIACTVNNIQNGS